jgi:hypothetical protein
VGGDHGFRAEYATVRRFVARLEGGQHTPEARRTARSSLAWDGPLTTTMAVVHHGARADRSGPTSHRLSHHGPRAGRRGMTPELGETSFRHDVSRVGCTASGWRRRSCQEVV